MVRFFRQASTGNYSTSLAGASVTIDGNLTFPSFASHGPINLQVPGGNATGLAPVMISTISGSPEFYVAGIILRANRRGAYPGRPSVKGGSKG